MPAVASTRQRADHLMLTEFMSQLVNCECQGFFDGAINEDDVLLGNDIGDGAMVSVVPVTFGDETEWELVIRASEEMAKRISIGGGAENIESYLLGDKISYGRFPVEQFMNGIFQSHS